MNDTKFKWLVSVVCLTAIIITAIVVITPKLLNNRAKKDTDDTLGEYVYVDVYNTIHTDRKCSRLNYKGMMSSRIHVAEIVNYTEDALYCPKCVSDRQYKKLTE
jgi:hypothetical protein